MVSSATLSIMSSLFGRHNSKAENTSYLYSVIVTSAATITWGIICLLNEGFKLESIGFSVIYGAFYTIAMIGMFKAYQIGSVSLTAFIKQLSLIAVSVWGFIFWGNSLTLNIAIGIILIVVALYLCLKTKESGGQKISLKWCLFAMMLLVGNAGCSIVQKYQQMAFNRNGNAFMFFGALFSLLVSVVLYLINIKHKPKGITKHTLVYPVIGGISSAMLNLLILHLITSSLSVSIIFPGIAVGGLSLTMFFSLVVYKEKLSVQQWCGFLIGVVALVFLNLA